MSRIRRSWNYLTTRSLFVAVCGTLVILAASLWGAPFHVMAGLVLVMALVVWRALIRPYRQMERNIILLVNGSTSELSKAPPISPASAEALEFIRQMLNPTQLYQMNKRQAQYLALQNQINPHFLYNTLESIRSEALVAQLNSVADMTESLATFFRYTISKVENLVSVEEELQNCQTYFRIQQYRFGDRLALNIECAPEDREQIYRCRLPKLSMQPILENSIIHGTELKIGTGHLTIHMERTEKRLLIRVSDDGLGMDEEALYRLNRRFGKANLDFAKEGREQGGLALVNVDNRIRLLFGEEYGLHVFSTIGVGTDVEISLPMITRDSEIQNVEVLQ